MTLCERSLPLYILALTGAVVPSLALAQSAPIEQTTSEDSGTTRVTPDVLTVAVDQATILRIPEKIGTIVVGNPMIADVTLQAGNLVVVTGKGYGATNVVALDRQGVVVMEKMVRVEGPRDTVVVVYRGIERETYSCQPRCERRITLGDGGEYFNATMGQAGARNSQAQGSQQQAR